MKEKIKSEATEKVNTIEMQGKAISKFNIVSHRKMTPICRAIRRLDYQQAIAYLKNISKKGSEIIEKTLKSAYSNVVRLDKNVTEEQCYVKEVVIGTGPNIKRMVPRARGRADIRFKRTSHVSAIVARRTN